MKKRKLLATSIATIAMCASLIAGGTYALFTSESTVNVAVTSGTVSVVAEASDLQLGTSLENNLPETDASMDGNTITLTNMVPGDTVTFKITVTNESNVTVKHRTLIKCVDDNGLMSGLDITIGDIKNYDGMTAVTDWATIAPGEGNKEIEVTITLPEDAGNEYQGKTCKLAYTVEAVQGNANTDGDKLEENTIGLYTVADLLNVAKNVNGGVENYKGKTLKLMNSIDLANVVWTPIGGSQTVGSKHEYSFQGTFDGNDKTISNLEVESTVAGNATAGFFGTALSATIQDLTLKDVDVYSTHYAGAICAYWADKVTVENCKVIGGTVTSEMELITKEDGSTYYDNGDKVGGIVGYGVNGSVTGCTVEGVTLNAARDVGGIAGAADGCTLTGNTVKNTTINYTVAKTDYQAAGEIASGRKAWTDGGNNTAENVSINFTNIVYVTPSTAQEAIEAATAGATIVLGAGEYAPLTIKNADGSAKSNLTIKGTKEAIVSLIVLNASGTKSSNITLENITFNAAKAQDTYSYSQEIAGMVASGYVSNITSNNTSSASAENVTIKGCKFVGTPVDASVYVPIDMPDGGRVSGPNKDFTIVENVFEVNAFNYIRLTNAQGTVTIKNNVFGGEEFATGHNTINATNNSASFDIQDNKFYNWNPLKVAFGSSYGGGTLTFTIKNNVFSNEALKTEADDVGGIINLKVKANGSGYVEGTHTIEVSGNSFENGLTSYTDATAVTYLP